MPSDTLVVGSRGTLGGLLVERLGAAGVDLRCADARDDRIVPEIAAAATVVNASGPRVRPGLGWADYVREHIGTTMTVLRSMRPGARLVHLSSTAVFGARGCLLSASSREAPTLFPSPAYACAKLAAETTARALGRERGVTVRVLRPSMVYGPRVESALGTIRRLASRGVRLRLRPDTVRQHLLHEELLIQAVERAATTPASPGETSVMLLADPFVLRNEDLAPPAGGGVIVPVDVSTAASAHAALTPVLRGVAPAALEALAVLGLDNAFDVAPTFAALGVDASAFDKARTFDSYWAAP
jgi:nucleoside-diphosphate-sugar epimerase